MVISIQNQKPENNEILIIIWTVSRNIINYQCHAIGNNVFCQWYIFSADDQEFRKYW